MSDHLAQAIEQMASPEHHASLTFRPPKKHAEEHACEVAGCRLSQEEHHRLAFGMIAENRDLKRRIAELEHAKSGQQS